MFYTGLSVHREGYGQTPQADLLGRTPPRHTPLGRPQGRPFGHPPQADIHAPL